MAKKHRVKRQKYVEHLLQLEKEREAYLEKRMRPKRSREERVGEERFGEVEENLMSGDKKRGRKEMANEEEVNPSLPTTGKGGDTNMSVKVEENESTATADISVAGAKTGKRVKRRY
ncbi:uncharacterized protein TM35_000171460 [Trypanosoma theileri]|uniref:Uncharacterized protein n=1 Tax=Trypanosoma theileri TaxID=67003 RepID=A0A1X0NU88_9TRYP|nr:uncharacterized protein TM35_000171460 [Trypanosoma theileri]ORC88274.1 hypothetical protein TM35_000171460 [Trypanosoma theileri]